MDLNFRKLTRLLTYYLLPAVLIVLTFVIKPTELSESLGVYALWTFSIVMFIKPIWYFLRKTKLGPILAKIKSFRREGGILTFWLFLFHGIGMMIKRSLFEISLYLDVNNNLFWGALGGIIIIILGITSNNISTRLLKQNWKKLQYLAYPGFIFVLIHAGFAERGENFILTSSIAGIFITIKVIEFWLKTRKNQPKTI